MNVYIVTYDLRKPGKNYSDLISAIKSYPMWGKITESCWLIHSSNDCPKIRDHLLSYMDNNDRLLVVQSARIAAWRNLIASNEWVKENI